MKTVREFSPAGPCLTLCEFVSETAARLTYRDRSTWRSSRAASIRWRYEATREAAMAAFAKSWRRE